VKVVSDGSLDPGGDDLALERGQERHFEYPMDRRLNADDRTFSTTAVRACA
jgi:hypothetical protein